MGKGRDAAKAGAEFLVSAVTVLVVGAMVCGFLWLWYRPLWQETGSVDDGGPSDGIYERVDPTPYEPREWEEPSAQWSCGLDPTINNDWHDDVLCSNGREWTRPYLRRYDSFMTDAELREAAAEYEYELNLGG